MTSGNHHHYRYRRDGALRPLQRRLHRLRGRRRHPHGYVFHLSHLCPRNHPRCGAHRRAFRPLSRTDTLQGLGASTERRQEHHRNHYLLSVTVLGTAGGLCPPAFFLLSFPPWALPQCYGSSVAGGEAAPGRVFFPLRACSLHLCPRSAARVLRRRGVAGAPGPASTARHDCARARWRSPSSVRASVDACPPRPVRPLFPPRQDAIGAASP